MLTAGTIRFSHSQYAPPAFLIAKDGGKDHRFIIDYRKLNKNVKCPAYPLPKTENLLAMVAGNRFYSRLDARSSFHQLKIVKNQSTSLHSTVILGTMSLILYSRV